jgi:hypothetical protein
MNSMPTQALAAGAARPVRLQDLAAMAALLERLDLQPRAVGAAQYREVVRCLGAMLAAVEPSPTLDALLSAAPATAELYENIHYLQAGLCRHPAAPAHTAETAAQAAIVKARRSASTA